MIFACFIRTNNHACKARDYPSKKETWNAFLARIFDACAKNAILNFYCQMIRGISRNFDLAPSRNHCITRKKIDRELLINYRFLLFLCSGETVGLADVKQNYFCAGSESSGELLYQRGPGFETQNERSVREPFVDDNPLRLVDLVKLPSF